MQKKYIEYNPDYVPEGFGMSNTGAICWWNALLQTLLGASGLTDIMFAYETEFANNNFALAYIKFLELALSNKATSSSSITLFNAFKERLALKSKVRLDQGQQCAHEGFTLFIEMLDNRRVDKLFTTSYEVTSTCSQCKYVEIYQRDTSFYITMGMNTRNDTLFTNWLRVHEGESTPRECPNCSKCTIGQKRVEKLKQLGEIVCVLFSSKLHTPTMQMHYPQSLSFSAKGGGVLKYKLIGSIEHAGVSNMTTFSSSGHYWARSVRCDSWLKFNDSLTPTVCSSTSAESTFMVFYHME